MTRRLSIGFKASALLWVLMLAVLVGGCVPMGGSAEAPDASGPAPESDGAKYVSQSESGAPAPAPPPATMQAGLDAEEAAPAEDSGDAPSKSSASSAARDVGRSRPGLGTVFGEDRDSRIHHVVFHRANPERPFAVAQLFYNDREGLEAMSRESARFDHGDGGFSVMDGAVTVRLLSAQGRPLPAFEVASRDYVLGENGQAYLIEVRNRTGNRIEAVATVDGLDVVDGEEGSFEKRGYVIEPFDVLLIDGFRRSTDTVATFRFGSVRDSYAGRKGKARNVGVVGVALFQERGSDFPWTSREVELRHTADPFPGRFAQPPPL